MLEQYIRLHMLGTGDMVLYVSNRISGFICWNNISGFICWEQDIWLYMLEIGYQALYAGNNISGFICWEQDIWFYMLEIGYQVLYAGNNISDFICLEQDIWFYMLEIGYQVFMLVTIFQALFASKRISGFIY